MSFWTARSLQQTTGGRWLIQPPTPGAAAHGLSIDSRNIQPGQCFLALRGDRFDGHDFLPQALERGASILIVSRDPTPDLLKAAQAMGRGVLAVRETLAALQELARGYRQLLRKHGTTVIGLTGSSGKTTTRHLIHAALSSSLRGTQSPKSFNNHIGVPLTLLAADPTDDFVVAELGTNHPGEIAQLAAIAQPDIAVITNIGTAHLEAFGTRDAIAAEKASLLRFVSPSGLAIVPGDEPLLSGRLHTTPATTAVVRFGWSSHNDLLLLDCSLHALGLDFNVAIQPLPVQQPCPTSPTTPDRRSPAALAFRLPLFGRHNALNALPAIAIAHWRGIDLARAADALAAVQGVPMRLQVVRLGLPEQPLAILNDGYNANPESVRAALATLSELQPPLPTGRRIAVLGDMFELGHDGPAIHRQLAETIASLGVPPRGSHPATHGCTRSPGPGPIDLAVFIGDLSRHAADALSQHWPPERVLAFPQWTDALPHQVASLLQPGDLVLIKASRGMRLERLIPAIQARFSTSAAPRIECAQPSA
jgi:UDP-N-acetylmuramoyl-tripeptide--D-alanyl-D-alanine ligase